jgi:guanine deaminase
MAPKIALAEIVGALEMATDEMHSYMNRQTGEVRALSSEVLGMAEEDASENLRDWQKEELLMAKQVLDSEDWLQLPSKFDVHEWEIMSQFGQSLSVPAHREEILDGIHGSGAFRVFKTIIRRLRLEDAWYAFRQSALEEIAKNWLESHGFEVPRDSQDQSPKRHNRASAPSEAAVSPGDFQGQAQGGHPSQQQATASTPSQADKQRFLGLAIAEATAGATSGQGGPFGAVVVKDGVVIAKACNAVVANNDPTAHAEVQAVRAACATLGTFQLDGCDIYASCEPCPMCLGAILWARPRALYYAATRRQAARAGFDDEAFFQAFAGGQAVPLERELVEHPEAKAPFSAYAKLPGKIKY